jgi:hypothetical protein
MFELYKTILDIFFKENCMQQKAPNRFWKQIEESYWYLVPSGRDNMG